MKWKQYIAVFFLICGLTARAGAVSVIRDTEVEELLQGYIRPIFQVAGLNPENAAVVILNDDHINAFVAGGQTIFVHTGLLLKAKTPDDVMFVLAHETGHIVGGHIVRGYQALQNAQTTALVSTVLGGVLAAASGHPEAGVAVIMGGQTSALGLFTKYRQTEESSADRTAVDIMNKLGYSMLGFENVMRLIKADERLNETDEENYLRTHPMTKTRIDELSRFLKNPKPLKTDPAFDFAQAKLYGFLKPPEIVLAHYSGTADPDLYAQAIAFYRQNDFDTAFQRLNRLIKRYPNNPYFYELKGQLFFEQGQLEKAQEAYYQASELVSPFSLIQLSYAHVLLELGGKENAKTAESLLKTFLHQEPQESFAWRLLAKSYDQQGKGIYAAYAMVEYDHALGQLSSAQERARKISDQFPADPVIRQRLQDVLSMKIKE